jgi:hypothetical protein
VGQIRKCSFLLAPNVSTQNSSSCLCVPLQVLDQEGPPGVSLVEVDAVEGQAWEESVMDKHSLGGTTATAGDRPAAAVPAAGGPVE